MATAVMLAFSKDSNRVTDDTGRVEIVKSFEEVEGFTGVPGTFSSLEDKTLQSPKILFYFPASPKTAQITLSLNAF